MGMSWDSRWISDVLNPWILGLQKGVAMRYIPGLVNIQKAMEICPVEIVDLPINSMVMSHSYWTVYQRVIKKYIKIITIIIYYPYIVWIHMACLESKGAQGYQISSWMPSWLQHIARFCKNQTILSWVSLFQEMPRQTDMIRQHQITSCNTYPLVI